MATKAIETVPSGTISHILGTTGTASGSEIGPVPATAFGYGAQNAAYYGMSPAAADNFSAFQSAMQASEKYLVIPPGNYTFTTANGTIALPGDKVVFAYGAKFTYAGANAAYPFRILTSNTERQVLAVAGLEIDVDQKANICFMIYGQDTAPLIVQSDLYLIDVTARNPRLGVSFNIFPAFGINVYGGFENVIFDGAKVYNVTREDGTGVGGGGCYGIGTVTTGGFFAKRVWIRNVFGDLITHEETNVARDQDCDFINIGGTGVNATEIGRYVEIDGLLCRRCRGRAVKVHGHNPTVRNATVVYTGDVGYLEQSGGSVAINCQFGSGTLENCKVIYEDDDAGILLSTPFAFYTTSLRDYTDFDITMRNCSVENISGQRLQGLIGLGGTVTAMERSVNIENLKARGAANRVFDMEENGGSRHLISVKQLRADEISGTEAAVFRSIVAPSEVILSLDDAVIGNAEVPLWWNDTTDAVVSPKEITAREIENVAITRPPIDASAGDGNVTLVAAMEFGKRYAVKVEETTAFNGDTNKDFKLGTSAGDASFLAAVTATGSAVGYAEISGTENVGSNIVLSWLNNASPTTGELTATVKVVG